MTEPRECTCSEDWNGPRDGHTRWCAWGDAYDREQRPASIVVTDEMVERARMAFLNYKPGVGASSENPRIGSERWRIALEAALTQREEGE